MIKKIRLKEFRRGRSNSLMIIISKILFNYSTSIQDAV